jgi:hypothetical protein
MNRGGFHRRFVAQAHSDASPLDFQFREMIALQQIDEHLNLADLLGRQERLARFRIRSK